MGAVLWVLQEPQVRVRHVRRLQLLRRGGGERAVRPTAPAPAAPL